MGVGATAVVGSRPLGWLARLPLWRGVLILGYHRVEAGSEEDAMQSGMVTSSALDAQLGVLTRYFDVISPDGIAAALRAPGRRVVLTFDDGYRDNYELALPLLRKHGVPATFFLTTGFLDDPRISWWDELDWMVAKSHRPALEAGEWLSRPLSLGDRNAARTELADVYKSLPATMGEAFLDACGEAAGTGRCDPRSGADLWMTWAMAAELRDAGMTIGGHTVRHPVLARAEPAAQASEIAGCARRLDEELGVTMRYFAYPVGLRSAFDQNTRSLLRSAGVELAFSLYGGFARPGDRFDPLDVPRATVGPKLEVFRAMLAFPGLFARW